MTSPGSEAEVTLGPLAAAIAPHAAKVNFCTYPKDGGISREGLTTYQDMIRDIANATAHELHRPSPIQGGDHEWLEGHAGTWQGGQR